MKKVITGITPVLLLVLALTFMSNYKQWDDLSDTERYQIQNYVEAAETETAESDTANANDNADANAQEEEQPDSDVASSNSEDIDDVAVDPNETYQIAPDEGNIGVYDNNGNAVFKVSKEDWEENIETYYEKFNLSSY
ncbi:hypothetical protein [Oceanobacillus timonensis]|uniref:hypothetical protein n=1 Tax=Oceanobacillus timonensis TaxID=1926285 RepID=UPI0009BBF347|nr:hypothetical protein [Oceanobacillus timonensis]